MVLVVVQGKPPPDIKMQSLIGPQSRRYGMKISAQNAAISWSVVMERKVNTIPIWPW